MKDKDKSTKGAAGLEKTTQAGAMATVPDYIDNEALGRENLDSRDITMPILCVTQGMTKQKSRTDPRYIPGLQDGALFNNLTSEIYPEKLRLVFLRVDKHAIEFWPRPADGQPVTGPQGIKDRNVPWDDKRCEFDGDKKPQAERFYDYLALRFEAGRAPEPIVVSMSRSKGKVAKQLNGLVALTGNKPMFAGAYEVTAVEDVSKTGGHKFFNFKITAAGWASAEEYAAAKDLFERMKGKTVEVEREREPDGGGDDFPPVPDPSAPVASREPGEDDV